MRIHPLPTNRHIASTSCDREFQSSRRMNRNTMTKKLKRLPHVFSKVLELPFRSDADVLVEEDPECFRFIVGIGGHHHDNYDDVGDEVRAIPVEIHPGVTKIVLRNGGCGDDEVELLLDELNIDTWRFRLPAATLPELATAVFANREIIVTVPKGGGAPVQDRRQVWGEGGRIILVQ